jgi:hypothetical protein
MGRLARMVFCRGGVMALEVDRVCAQELASIASIFPPDLDMGDGGALRTGPNNLRARHGDEGRGGI